MTDVFAMFPHFDANNNTATNNNPNNFQSNRQNATGDKSTMLQLNNYSSLDFNPNLFDYQDESANCYNYNNHNNHNNQYRMQTEEHSPPHKPEIIHSGHFMVSEIDKDDDADNEATVEEETVKVEKELIKNDQQVKIKSVEYSLLLTDNRFNGRQMRKNWNIDYPKLPSLDALFKKLNLGNDSKLVSPKWKQFTGFKMSLKAKIRVNNLIWRAWFIKCTYQMSLLRRID